MTQEQIVILSVAAKIGWYSVTREYNAEWPADSNAIKQLEGMGLLKLESLERNPLTKQFTRKSAITDEGRAALESALTKQP